jgi:hypothetical protein
LEPEPEPFRGTVIIEWPAPVGPLPYSALLGRAAAVTDAVTGKPITTCSGITVRAVVDEIVTAELTLFADADGNPVLDGKPVLGDGEILTGTFPFAVAAMRVAG